MTAQRTGLAGESFQLIHGVLAMATSAAKREKKASAL